MTTETNNELDGDRILEESLREDTFSGFDERLIEEESLKRKLKFFYMNPIEKWNSKRKFPFKLLILIVKIILVTIQLCYFAHRRTTFIDFMFSNKISFCHLFLSGWDATREVIAYPPQSGDLAIYKISDFYTVIDYAVINYANLDDAIGSYKYPNNSSMGHIQMCLKLKNGLNESNNCKHYNCYNLNDFQIRVECLTIIVTKENSKNFSIKNYFDENKIKLEFSSLIDATLSFEIKTVHSNLISLNCFSFNISIKFDNKHNSGQMKYDLTLNIKGLNCDKKYFNPPYSIIISLLNFSVIIICCLSIILCVRSLLRTQYLKKKTIYHFKKYYSRNVSWEGRMEFFNPWYVITIFGDVLILISLVFRYKIEEDEFSGDELNMCSLILGCGNFLVWFSLLRYLCFFKTYNAIILTLKMAAPNIFRFMVCVLLIYSSFTFSGWLILGPYHMKFRTLSGTSECLFALINGDDVFATFNTLQPTDSKTIWYFCRIYLYVFISLFIYVVLSLFLSIVEGAYEIIKQSGKDGFPKSDIKTFIETSLNNSLQSLASSSYPDCTLICNADNLKLKNITAKICCCQSLLKNPRT